MYNHLFFILLILVVLLLYKYYFESTYEISSRNNNIDNNKNNKPYNAYSINYDNANSFEKNNSEFNKMVEDMQKETMAKINHAIEQGVIEGYQNSGYQNSDYQNLDYYGIDKETDTNTNTNTDTTQINTIHHDSYFTKDIDALKPESDFNVKSIKANSHKFKETNKNKNKNDNVISYLNKGNTTKIMLFYKDSCPYCSEFMPVWYKIINNLANNVLYEEIECEKDYKKANEYQISSVPTIILLINNEKKVYIGDRNYTDIMRFLKLNGVNLVERSFEQFNSTDDSSELETVNKNKGLCPSVTFDTQLDVAQDNYMFQIFNTKGQYGYATGGYNKDKELTPFTAAYSTVDSYLTSLPSGANISECANQYTDQIRGFGLCDKTQLDNILQYQEDISNGNSKPRIDGTDYSSNKKVITAIKTACRL